MTTACVNCDMETTSILFLCVRNACECPTRHVASS